MKMPDFADRLAEKLDKLVEVGGHGAWGGLDIEAATKLIRERCVDKALHDVCMGVIHESSHPPVLEEFVDPVAQMRASPEFEKEVDALYASPEFKLGAAELERLRAERKARVRKHVQFHAWLSEDEDDS